MHVPTDGERKKATANTEDMRDARCALAPPCLRFTPVTGSVERETERHDDEEEGENSGGGERMWFMCHRHRCTRKKSVYTQKAVRL